MTKGFKIWLWVLIVGGIITILAGFYAMSYSDRVGAFSAVMGLAQLSGSCLLLFKQRKEGYAIICAMSIINFFYNLFNGINVFWAIFLMIAMPGITYFFMTKWLKGETEKKSSTMNGSTSSNSENMQKPSENYATVDEEQTKKKETFNKVFTTTSDTAKHDTEKTTAQNFQESVNKKSILGSGKNIKVDVDFYKELEIDRSWDEKTIRNHLKNILKIWIQRQGATNDKEQLMIISNIVENAQNAMKYLTKAARRQQYDLALELAYQEGKIVDVAEEQLHTILEQAREYYRKGNIKLATKFAEEAVEGEVNDASAYDLLARCYFDTNAYDKALQIIDHGLSIFKQDINLHWLGARIATIGTKNFDDAQQRVNRIIELEPENSLGHSEQIYLHLRSGDEKLAFEEIDSYIEAHPDDAGFKQGVAYDLDAYSNTCYYYDATQDALFIADKDSYKRCLNLRTKATGIFEDEYTKKQLENAQYYGKKEWNDWNLPAIKSLAIYGTIFSVMGLASTTFLALGIVLYLIMGVLIGFSFRPYWQINKSYITGKMGTLEWIVSKTGEASAKMAELLLRFLIQAVSWIIRFCVGLASGRWF